MNWVIIVYLKMLGRVNYVGEKYWRRKGSESFEESVTLVRVWWESEWSHQNDEDGLRCTLPRQLFTNNTFDHHHVQKTRIQSLRRYKQIFKSIQTISKCQNQFQNRLIRDRKNMCNIFSFGSI